MKFVRWRNIDIFKVISNLRLLSIWTYTDQITGVWVTISYRYHGGKIYKVKPLYIFQTFQNFTLTFNWRFYSFTHKIVNKLESILPILIFTYHFIFGFFTIRCKGYSEENPRASKASKSGKGGVQQGKCTRCSAVLTECLAEYRCVFYLQLK